MLHGRPRHPVLQPTGQDREPPCRHHKPSRPRAPRPPGAPTPHLHDVRQAVQALEAQRRIQLGGQPPLRRLVVQLDFDAGLHCTRSMGGAATAVGTSFNGWGGDSSRYIIQWVGRRQQSVHLVPRPPHGHPADGGIRSVRPCRRSPAACPGAQASGSDDATPAAAAAAAHCAPAPAALPRRRTVMASRCSRSCRALSHTTRPCSPGYCAGSRVTCGDE